MVKQRKNEMSQAALARALGVSGAMVTKHKARGMPTDSLGAALSWRAGNLDPSLIKAIRRPELVRTFESSTPDATARANELGRSAQADLQRENWREFVAHVEELRGVLCSTPAGQDGGVRLPVEIWDALCGFPGPWSAHTHSEKRN